MTNSTDAAFEQIGLHDARIAAVVIESDSVLIQLREAFISPEHPCNTLGVWACVDPAELHFRDISQHFARTWIDADSAWGPYHFPLTSPIESEVMESSETSDDSQRVFTLTGFGTSGWTEWLITAATFQLTWSSMRAANQLLTSEP